MLNYFLRHSAQVTLLGLACSVFLSLFGCTSLETKQYRKVSLLLESSQHEQVVVELNLERLLTEFEQARGLMFVSHLPENGGALLEYRQEARRGIWMKNMLMPIDALFVNAQGQIVATFSEIQPCHANARCPIYEADNTQYILETPVGVIKRHGIQAKHARVVFD